MKHPHRMVSVKEVADRAGVSVGTVSNVLNYPDKVSQKTATRVQQAIEELGFIRNDAARQLRVGMNRAIGLIVLDVSNPFFTDLAHGIEERVAQDHRPIILGDSNEDADREREYLDLFEEQRVSGLLISPVEDVISRLDRLRARGTKVVLVDRMATTPNYSSVSLDDWRGGELAVHHLADIGCRKIAFLGASPEIVQIRRRMGGANAAATERGLPELEFFEVEGQKTIHGIVGGERIASLPDDDRPDAVFTSNDLVAIGALQSFLRAGLRVPEDIAIIGYDDIDFAAASAIPLSSIRQPSHEMGLRAAQLLLDEVNGETEPERHHVIFQPALVKRESTERKIG